MDQEYEVGGLTIQKIFVGFSQVVIGAPIVVQSLQGQDNPLTICIRPLFTHKARVHKRNINIKGDRSCLTEFIREGSESRGSRRNQQNRLVDGGGTSLIAVA